MRPRIATPYLSLTSKLTTLELISPPVSTENLLMLVYSLTLIVLFWTAVKKALSLPFYFNILIYALATLFDQCVSSFLDKSSSSAPKISIAPKFLIYFYLPCTDSHGFQIHTQLIKLLLSTFPQI